MNACRRSVFVVLVILGFFLVEATSVAHADSTSDAYSSVPSTSQDVTLSNNGAGVVLYNGSPGSIGTIYSSASDSANSAKSYVNPTTGSVGAAVSGNGYDYASASHDDTFRCGSSAPCTYVPVATGSAPLQYSFHLDFSVGGAAIPNTYWELQATDYINPIASAALGGTFQADIWDDGSCCLADVLTSAASFTDLSGNVTNIPVSMTTGANGDLHFSLDYSTPAVVLCTANCVPVVLSSGSNSVDVFGESQSLSVDFEPYNSGGPDSGFVDAYSTFTAGITSYDPSFQPVSFDGQTLTLAGPVPEPESYAMLLAGLGLLGFIARRRCPLGKALSRRVDL